MFKNDCFGMTCNISAIFNTKTWKTKCLLQLLWLISAIALVCSCDWFVYHWASRQVGFRVPNNMQLNIGIGFCIEGCFLTMANGQ
jgi:hypothetical protein